MATLIPSGAEFGSRPTIPDMRKHIKASPARHFRLSHAAVRGTGGPTCRWNIKKSRPISLWGGVTGASTVSGNSHLFKKGQQRPPNSGRKKGTPNKVPPMLKQAILLAAGGGSADQLVDYLTRLATKHPRAFAPLLDRVLAYEARQYRAAQKIQARPD